VKTPIDDYIESATADESDPSIDAMPEYIYLEDKRFHLSNGGSWCDRPDEQYVHCYQLMPEPPLVDYAQMWISCKHYMSQRSMPLRLEMNEKTFHYIRNNFSPMKVTVEYANTRISFGMVAVRMAINNELEDGHYMFMDGIIYGEAVANHAQNS
jgi:hypothetical protein